MFGGLGDTWVGRGHEFCFLLYRLNVFNDPAGWGSGEYCMLFSLAITTVTKSLGLGVGGGGEGEGGGQWVWAVSCGSLRIALQKNIQHI